MSLKTSDIKFLLINPSADEWRVKSGSKPPRATRIFRFSMLTSMAVEASLPPGVRTRIVDEEVQPVDYHAQADLVGISSMTFNAPRAYRIAARFRERGIPVIMGGYHPTFMPEEALLHADAVCAGEAETVLPRMIEDFRGGRMTGLYRGGPFDLKGLSRPKRDLISRESYVWADPIQATRGCPHSCQFCSISAFFQSIFRTRPVEEVLDELRGLSRYILFMDDNITADREYALELFSRMIPLRKRWFSQAGVNIARDPELLKLASESGCRGLFLGMESVCQESLEGWDKGFNSSAQYVSAVKSLHNRGIGVIAGVVLGADQDTPEVFQKTLDFLRESRVDALQATILTPFPGTPLYLRMEKEGRILERDWCKYDFGHPVFRPARMSREILHHGHRTVLTRFYSRSRMARRFADQLLYLKPSSLLMASIPVNLSYRRRLAVNRTFLPSRPDA